MEFTDAFEFVHSELHYVKSREFTTSKFSQSVYHVPVDISSTRVNIRNGDSYMVCNVDGASIHIVHRPSFNVYIVRIYVGQPIFTFGVYSYDHERYAVSKTNNVEPIALKTFGNFTRAVEWSKDYIQFGILEDIFNPTQSSNAYIK